MKRQFGATGTTLGIAVTLSLCVLQLVSAGPAAASSKISPPTTGIYLGAFVDPNQRWDGVLKQEGEIQGFEHRIGRKLAIDHHYYGWSGSSQMFPAAMDRWDVQN